MTGFAQLAAGFGTLDWSIYVIGVFVAGVLIASFVWGARRKRREPPPLAPPRAPGAPDPDSWTTRDHVDDPSPRRAQPGRPHDRP